MDSKETPATEAQTPETQTPEQELEAQTKQLEGLQKDITALYEDHQETGWQLSYKLATAKPLVAKTGRAGGWSQFCRDCHIPLSTADSMVQAYHNTLSKVPTQFHEAITESGVSLFGEKAQAALEKELPLMKEILKLQPDAVKGYAETIAANIKAACRRQPSSKKEAGPDSLDALVGKIAGAAFNDRPELARKFSTAFVKRLETAKKPIKDEVEQAVIVREVLIPAFMSTTPTPVETHISAQPFEEETVGKKPATSAPPISEERKA